MIKRDIKTELKHLYKPSDKYPAIVNVPAFNYLMFDGFGDPNLSKLFQSGVETLFSLSYTLKFMVREEYVIDYGVMPLEGLWWMENDQVFDVNKRDAWKWTIMIMQPEYIDAKILQEGIQKVRKKKPSECLNKIRFSEYNEGIAMQLMHIGPFTEEGPNIERIHTAIEKSGGIRTGKHHEIYLSDFRKTAPDKLKTILRQPYK
jgi:hypothetical protein